MKILWTVLKAILVLAVIIGLAAGIFLLSTYMGWDWRIGEVILLGVIALILLIILVRKLIFRRREEGFVRQVIEQEAGAAEGGPAFERGQLRDLEERWKEAISSIKKSHLKRRRGNPIYALPWYVMIGSSGSGKTMALRNSRLPSAFPELGHPAGETATKNLDWWFFDHAIVLDTAGRYTIHADMVRDKEEWKKFLSLLSKSRTQEPINGLIITVPADQLRDHNTEPMEHYGRIVYQAIDQVMRVLGHSFPVYVLVTKLDQVPGMNSFCGLLPWGAFGQAMGNINRAMTPDPIAFLDETLASVTDRLKDLRLAILEKNPTVDPAMLLFPEEMVTMRAGLAAFLRWGFQENPYHESPVIRGLYFGSSQQVGSVSASTLEDMGVSRPIRSDLPGTNRGFFLQDFFTHVLPDDRYLNHPIREFIGWRRSNRIIAAVAIVAVAVVLCGMIVLAYRKNQRAIRLFDTGQEAALTEEEAKRTPLFSQEIKHQMDVIPKQEKAFQSDVAFMQKLENRILLLESSNAKWLMPWMGLEQSLDLERRLKRAYVDLMDRGVLTPIDQAIDRDVEAFERRKALPSSRDDEKLRRQKTGDYAEHLVKRINLLSAHLDDDTAEDLLSVADERVPPDEILTLVNPSYRPSRAGEFLTLYAYRLEWDPDKKALRDEKVRLQKRLLALLTATDEDMAWLADWADRRGGLSRFVLADFWMDKFDDSERTAIMVEGPFTLAGDKFIKELIGQMRESLPSREKKDRSNAEFVDEDFALLPDRLSAFRMWYRRMYLAEWHQFAEDFVEEEPAVHWPVHLDQGMDFSRDRDGRSVGDQGLAATHEPENYVSRTRDQWKVLANQMTSFNNPYSNLILEMADQFGIFDDSPEDPLPSWVVLVKDFTDRKKEVERLGKEKGTESTGLKSVDTKLRFIERIKGAAEKGISKAKDLKGIQELMDYKKALYDVSPVLESQDRAYQLAGAIFTKAGAGESFGTAAAVGEVSNSPFIRGYASVSQQKSILGAARQEEEVFWQLNAGPLDFLMYYTIHESACYIQDIYDETILAEIQGIPDESLQAELYGEKGLMWQFTYSQGSQGPAGPFLGRNRKGFYAKESYNRKMPFLNTFLRNLSRGYISSKQLKVQEDYQVTIEALPTDVNPEARTKPQEVVVEMECGDTMQRLENYNYPIAQKFKWSPSNCGPVSLEIFFRKFSIKKVYRGDNDPRGIYGFAKFLQEFRNGYVTFTPAEAEFLAHKTELDILDIKAITVRFIFSGENKAVVDRIERTPIAPDEKIVYCWR